MQSEGGNAAVVAGLDTLPMSGLIIGVFAVVAVIFVSTTYDSASYTSGGLSNPVTRRV